VNRSSRPDGDPMRGLMLVKGFGVCRPMRVNRPVASSLDNSGKALERRGDSTAPEGRAVVFTTSFERADPSSSPPTSDWGSCERAGLDMR